MDRSIRLWRWHSGEPSRGEDRADRAVVNTVALLGAGRTRGPVRGRGEILHVARVRSCQPVLCLAGNDLKGDAIAAYKEQALALVRA